MKHLFIFLLFLSLPLSAQDSQVDNELQFNKRFVQCEDKWVIFQPDENNQYHFGFIYIDEGAGLTLDHAGSFTIGSIGEYIPKKLEEVGSVKIRLEPNNILVALVPKNRYEELQIKEIPDWLKFYKTNENSIERLYKWGYMYNGWGECKTALPFLLKAKEVEPNYSGLNVEIAYSYNCLEEYEKAATYLEEEIKNDPSNAYVNKEYIYSYIKMGKVEKAITQFNQSVKDLEDTTFHSENCFNIMQHYYMQKDEKNFSTWYNRLQEFENNNPLIQQYAERMKKQMEQ